MELFNDVLSHEESLFVNEDVLRLEFLPDALPHREDEVRAIADNIKVLFKGRGPSNLFIYGPPSTGKTVSIRYVFDQLRQASEDIVPIYINCWENTTTHSVFVEMAKRMAIPFPSKGVSTEVISKSLFSKLSNREGAVFCFDEMDKSEDLDYLYSIAENMGRKACVILITNDKKSILSIEPRVRSRLCLEEMEFNEYSEQEMADILKERTKAAFVPEVVEQAVVAEVARVAYEKGDLRAGLSLLMKAGRIAEEDASRKVELNHVKKASESMTSFPQKRSRKLEGEEREIYTVISENSGKVTGELYDAYRKKGGELTKRSFRMYLNRLEKKGLVKAEDTGKGFRGRSRRVSVVGGGE